MTLYNRAIITTTLAILLVACNKADTNIPVPTYDESYVTATSATYLDGESRPWYSGDDITIFHRGEWDTEGKRFITTLKYDGGSSSVCTFRGMTFTNINPLYYAIYPYNYTNEIDYDNQRAALDMVQVQHYDASYDGDYAAKYNPSVAESTELDNFEFVNLCGALRFELAGRGDVASIDVTVGSSRALWGRATIDMDSKEILTIENSDQDKSKITLDCGDGLSLSEIPTSFAIALPPTGEDMITISVNFTDATSVDLVTGTADCISKMGVLNVGLSYLDYNTLVDIVSIDGFEAAPEGTLWVISSETNPTTEQIDAVVEKALESDGVKVVFMDVETLPAIELEPQPASLSLETNMVSLSFPELSSIGANALSLWTGRVSDLSILSLSSLSIAEGAFDGFDTLSCNLSLKEEINPYVNTFDVRLQWSDEEWGSINGERIYTLADFASSGLLTEEGAYPVGNVWWVDMDGDPSVGGTVTMAGLNAAVLACGATDPISIRFMGATTAGVEEKFNYGLRSATYLKEVDLSCFSAVPTFFMQYTNAERVILSNNITAIGIYAFMGSYMLTTVEFTEEERTVADCYSIGNWAFGQTSRDSDDYGDFVFEYANPIGNSAFDGCKKLNSLSLPRATTFGSNLIAYHYALTALYLTAEGDFSYEGNATSISDTFRYNDTQLGASVTLYLNEDKMAGGSATETPDPAYDSDGSAWTWLFKTDGVSPLYWKDIQFVSSEE